MIRANLLKYDLKVCVQQASNLRIKVNRSVIRRQIAQLGLGEAAAPCMYIEYMIQIYSALKFYFHIAISYNYTHYIFDFSNFNGISLRNRYRKIFNFADGTSPTSRFVHATPLLVVYNLTSYCP